MTLTLTLEELAQINLDEERKGMSEEYREEYYEILRQATAFKEALYQHRVKCAQDIHRGYIGDLQLVRQRLDDLIAFLEADKIASSNSGGGIRCNLAPLPGEE